MSDRVKLFRVVCRGGVVVPEAGCELPEGSRVQFWEASSSATPPTDTGTELGRRGGDSASLPRDE